MADDAERGHPRPGEPPASTSVTPGAVPDMEVFGDVTSLAASLHPDPEPAPEPPVPADPRAGQPTDPPAGTTGPEPVTDEERNRYGMLLDRAAERGLLEPSEYEVRLKELAEATTTEQMMQIVTELPAFNPLPASTVPKRSRPAGHSSARGVGGSKRRVTVWALLGLLVLVAVASLVILAVSAERLTHRQGHGSAPAPATRPVSDPRL